MLEFKKLISKYNITMWNIFGNCEKKKVIEVVENKEITKLEMYEDQMFQLNRLIKLSTDEIEQCFHQLVVIEAENQILHNSNKTFEQDELSVLDKKYKSYIMVNKINELIYLCQTIKSSKFFDFTNMTTSKTIQQINV